MMILNFLACVRVLFSCVLVYYRLKVLVCLFVSIYYCFIVVVLLLLLLLQWYLMLLMLFHQ